MKFFMPPKRVLRILVCIAIAMMIAPLAGAQDVITGDSPVLDRIISSGVLKVGVNPLFKPFSFFKEDKQEKQFSSLIETKDDSKKERMGVDIDIAKLLAMGLGVKLEIVVPDSFSDLIPMVQDEKVDVVMAGMTINFKRAKKVDFTNPYYDTGLSIMLNKGMGGPLGLTGVKSYSMLMNTLRARGQEGNLIIAVTKGKSPARSVPLYFPKAQVKEFPTNEEAATAVADGIAHIMVHDEIFLKMWVMDNKDKALYKLEVFPKPFKPDYYGFAVKKGNQDFVNMLNIFIRELYVEGYFKQIMQQYLSAYKIPAKWNVGEGEL